MHRYALRDDQWARIKDFLPGREGHVGGTAADNRLFVDAVIYRYRTGIPWRDLPERYGAWKPTHKRSADGAKVAFSRAFLEALAHVPMQACSIVDGVAPMQLCRRPKDGEDQAIGGSRRADEIHAIVVLGHASHDALGNPVALSLTPGQAPTSRRRCRCSTGRARSIPRR
jgi:transposase